MGRFCMNFENRQRLCQRREAPRQRTHERHAGLQGDVKRALAWLGPRMLGHDLPPPR